MKVTLTLLLALFACNSGCATTAAARECSKTEAIEAEQLAVNLKTWDEVYRAFTKFKHCDDGAIGEGFSESVSQLLANMWHTLPDLRRLTERHRAFEDFVLKHVDETMSVESARKIKDNTKNRCPKGASELCKKVEASVSIPL